MPAVERVRAVHTVERTPGLAVTEAIALEMRTVTPTLFRIEVGRG